MPVSPAGLCIAVAVGLAFKRTVAVIGVRMSSKATLAALGLLFVLICVAVDQPAFSADDSFKRLKIGAVPAGTLAAPFEMPSLDGSPVTSKELAGKIVLLNFWATYCIPCREEIPALNSLQHELQSQGLKIIGATLDDDVDGVNAYQEEVR